MFHSVLFFYILHYRHRLHLFFFGRLKFVVGASGVDLFISSDMFYLEIILEPSGAVKDVKIHHEGKVGYSQNT